ncbi:MAG: hypothetical protein ACRDD7_12935 [Peptostreptococcaceae bacterium]
MEKTYENNIRQILQLVQMNHLKDFKEWGINRGKKSEAINGLISVIDNDKDKFEYFKEWLSTFTIDGYNQYYVFNYSNEILPDEIISIVENIEVESLLDMDIINIEKTSVIYRKYDSSSKRLIIRFVSPAIISTRDEDENGYIEYGLENTFYFATVFIDLDLRQVIVSIPHTTGIRSVDNVETKARDFSKIAKYYIDKIKLILIDCNIDIENCDDWIYDATHELAEEGSDHNNPVINEKYESNKSEIEDFAKALMKSSDIDDRSIIDNFKEGVCILYENMLIEEFGVIEDENKYITYMQNADGTNSFVRVGSKTSNLKSGREYAIAKTSRSSEEVKGLGVMKSFNGILSKFLIETIDEELYVIKTDTSKFIEERVIYDVIRKVGNYKLAFRQQR